MISISYRQLGSPAFRMQCACCVAALRSGEKDASAAHVGSAGMDFGAPLLWVCP
jgi:hypothetical protein